MWVCLKEIKSAFKIIWLRGFTSGSTGKESICWCRRTQDSISGLGESHMLRAAETMRLTATELCSQAQRPQLPNPCTLESILTARQSPPREACTHHSKEEHPLSQQKSLSSNKDPVQLKINEKNNKLKNKVIWSNIDMVTIADNTLLYTQKLVSKVDLQKFPS